MRAYARKWGEGEEIYAVTGLLHDLDYERYPDLDTGHPRKALESLFEERSYPREPDRRGCRPRHLPRRPARDAHGQDALCRRRASPGFVAACALVRPTGINGMKPKSRSRRSSSSRASRRG